MSKLTHSFAQTKLLQCSWKSVFNLKQSRLQKVWVNLCQNSLKNWLHEMGNILTQRDLQGAK